jgi:hypothetical protein
MCAHPIVPQAKSADASTTRYWPASVPKCAMNPGCLSANVIDSPYLQCCAARFLLFWGTALCLVCDDASWVFLGTALCLVCDDASWVFLGCSLTNAVDSRLSCDQVYGWGCGIWQQLIMAHFPRRVCCEACEACEAPACWQQQHVCSCLHTS